MCADSKGTSIMASVWIKRLSLSAILLAILILLVATSLFLDTDKFINHSLQQQRGNRYIIKVNLILQKGVQQMHAALNYQDSDSFIEAINLVDSAAGYLGTLADDLVMLNADDRAQILAMVAKMENLYDNYLATGRRVPASELEAIDQSAAKLYLKLSRHDTFYYERLLETGRKIRFHTQVTFALITVLALLLLAAAFYLRRGLTIRIRMAGELTEAKNKLEQRVELRTRQLGDSNARLSREVEERTEVQQAINSMVESIVGTTGKDSFDGLTQGLAGWLNVDYVILGEIVDNEKVRTLSMFADGSFVEKFEYALPGTPCEKLIAEGYCAYAEGVTKLFPKDKDLIRLGVDGYVGVPVVNEQGKALGILCALSRGPLQERMFWPSVMAIMASKAAAEIVRMRFEAEREHFQAQLLQNQKLEALGTLAGGIAHDFNNIIAAILGYSQMLQKMLPIGSKAEKANQEVLRATHRAKDLTSQILTFSRKNEQDRSAIHLHTIVNEAMALIRQTIPKTISIDLDLDRERDLVLANPTQIHQIVMNLCTNAYHAMRPNGGKLLVALKPVTFDPGSARKPSRLADGDYVRLTVADSGTGIPDEVLEKVFEPFFTTKKPGEGTGMGLPVVHGIVHDCCGDIEITSSTGKGTKIDVYFPLYTGDEVSVGSRDETISFGAGEHILVIDDEVALAELTAGLLEDLGYRVDYFYSSQDALRHFSRSFQDYDLVITDQSMPELAGLELAQKMLVLKPDLPIIICTGYSDVLSELNAQKCGVRKLLLKPVTLETLSVTVRDLLAA